MIRVAVETATSAGNRTGVGSYTRSLIGELRQAAGIEVIELAGPRLGPHVPLPSPVQWALSAAWLQTAFSPGADRAGVDLIHCPVFFGPVRHRLPLVVTVHDIFFRQFPDHYPAWWRAYADHLLSRLLPGAAAIITDSESVRSDVLSTWQVDPMRVHVAYLGVQPAPPPSADEPAAPWSPPGLTPGRYILHVGAHVARKNLPLLIECVARLRNSGELPSDYRLVLVGSGSRGMPGVSAVQEALRHWKVDDITISIPRASDDDLRRYYRNAGVFAFPSIHEGFGLPPLEAMAAGAPVVAFRSTSIPEVVGDAGILVPAGDADAFTQAILSVVSSSALARNLSKLSRDRAALFPWSRTARQTVAAYNSALGRSTQ